MHKRTHKRGTIDNPDKVVPSGNVFSVKFQGCKLWTPLIVEG